MTIHYVSVPEFGSDRANNFSVRLDAGGGITFSYLGVLAPDGLVGITEGNMVVDPGATDLSRSIVLPKAGHDVRAVPGDRAAVRHAVPQALLPVSDERGQVFKDLTPTYRPCR